MILTCPNCATRYSADAAKFPADGRQVRCAKCGHTWHQAGPTPEELAAEPAVAAAVVPPPPASEPVRETVAAAPEQSSIRDSIAIPAAAVAAEKPRRDWVPALGVAAGWAGLIIVVLLIGFSAVRYRQEISVIWPQSASVYSGLGMNVNAHGVDFTDVAYRRESEDGQSVLAVSGKIVNNGDRELPVPQSVRVTLSDDSNHEIYHWNFAPSAASLKPKQAVPFLTRLSSPPAAARHLEVRFAKDGQ